MCVCVCVCVCVLIFRLAVVGFLKVLRSPTLSVVCVCVSVGGGGGGMIQLFKFSRMVSSENCCVIKKESLTKISNFFKIWIR